MVIYTPKHHVEPSCRFFFHRFGRLSGEIRNRHQLNEGSPGIQRRGSCVPRWDWTAGFLTQRVPNHGRFFQNFPKIDGSVIWAGWNHHLTDCCCCSKIQWCFPKKVEEMWTSKSYSSVTLQVLGGMRVHLLASCKCSAPSNRLAAIHGFKCQDARRWQSVAEISWETHLATCGFRHSEKFFMVYKKHTKLETNNVRQ